MSLVEQEIAALNRARKFLEGVAANWVGDKREAAVLLAHYPNATQIEHLYGTIGKVARLEAEVAALTWDRDAADTALRCARDQMATEVARSERAGHAEAKLGWRCIKMANALVRVAAQARRWRWASR